MVSFGQIPSDDELLVEWLKERQLEIKPAEVAFLRDRAIARGAEQLASRLVELEEKAIRPIAKELIEKRLPASIDIYLDSLIEEYVADALLERVVKKAKEAVKDVDISSLIPAKKLEKLLVQVMKDRSDKEIEAVVISVLRNW